jgi:MFS family permease
MVGAFEAGFFPTAVTYLSLFYHRYDLGVRIALFYGQYAIAGAFSGAIGMVLFWSGECLLILCDSLRFVSGRRDCFAQLAVPIHNRRWTHYPLRRTRVVLAAQWPRGRMVPERGRPAICYTTHRQR